MKKYAEDKINEYINKNDYEQIIWNAEDTIEFKKFLETKKKTTQMVNLISLTEEEFSILINGVIDEINRKLTNNRMKVEIQKSLEELFISNEDKHIGTKKLEVFYNKYGIDYRLANQRSIHNGRISKFRQSLKIKPMDYWLISGKIMKDKLKLDYTNTIEGISGEAIDGWCYTNNSVWLNDFFEHEISKYKDLQEAYEHYKESVGEE